MKTCEPFQVLLTPPLLTE